MKKTLLILVMAFSTITVMNAQKVWVVGNDATNFPISAGIGAGPDLVVYQDGLGIHTGSATNTNMGQVEALAKSFGDVSYPNRFKFNGGGYPSAAATDEIPTTNMPTQRFLTITVSGPGTIAIQGVTGSSSSSRRLFITDGTDLVGTMIFPEGSAISEETVTYSGGPATLYIYCNAALNLYNISASSYITASIENVIKDNGITVSNSKINNPKSLSLEVYNLLGKNIAKANTSISTANFQKGVYVVKIANSNEVMKIMIN